MSKNFSRRLPADENISRGEQVSILVNGKEITGYLGESVATVLLSQEIYAMRTTVEGQPRGIFCGMGVCFDCLVVVDGEPNTRACMTWIKDGMDVRTQTGLSASK